LKDQGNGAIRRLHSEASEAGIVSRIYLVKLQLMFFVLVYSQR